MALSNVVKGLKETYRMTRRYGQFTDTPRDRFHELIFSLFASRELPNIILGGAISSSITWFVGTAPWTMPALAWAAWSLSVVNYMLAQEVIVAYRAASQRFESDPRGIH